MGGTDEGESSETERQKDRQTDGETDGKNERKRKRCHFRREGKIGVENEEVSAARERAERES